jgi:hypothetical protein
MQQAVLVCGFKYHSFPYLRTNYCGICLCTAVQDPLLIHGHACVGTLNNMQEAASACLSYSVATFF